MQDPVIFITGATGFVGRHVVEYLLDQVPQAKLVCLVRNPEKATFLQGTPVQCVEGDLLLPETYKGWAQQASLVFHVAALVGLKNGEAFYSVNTGGMARLLETLTDSDRLERLVFVSSISAIDRALPDLHSPLSPLTEESPARPSTDYGKSKRQAEELLMASGLPYTILRPSYIYGAYPRLASSMDRVVFDVREHKPYTRFPFPGRASEIYAGDLAAAIWHVSRHPQALNEDFFVANLEPVGVPTLFETLARDMKVPYRPRRLSDPQLKRIRKRVYREHPGDPVMRILYEDYFVCRAEKLREKTGFSPVTSFAQGWAKTLDWYRQRPDWNPA